MYKLLSILLLTALAGCAGQLGPKVCKSGGTVSEFERDKYDCEMKTRSGTPAMVLVDFDMQQRCMAMEKGWHKCSAEELTK